MKSDDDTKNNDGGILNDGSITFTRARAKKLLDQIASMAEKSFRRGFQHGICSQADEREGYAFRYECVHDKYWDDEVYRHCPRPPWDGHAMGPATSGMTTVQRLRVEMPNLNSFTDLNLLYAFVVGESL